ncbi:MAG: glycosyltransferase [Thermomicrobiales bacterium]
MRKFAAGKASVVVVVPTYNERLNIQTLASGVLGLGDNYRLVIVDDGSPDGTGELADDLAADHPGRVTVLHRPGKGGLGPAYIAGFRHALSLRPDLIAQMDADLSHDPAALPALVAAAREADLVIGSRYISGGGTVGWPFWRQLLSRMGGRYARAVLDVPISDLTGGFKVWRRETLAALDLDAIRSDGYGFAIETTWRAIRAGARVREVPILFTDRVAGASKLSRRIVAEAAVLVWRLRGEGTMSDESLPVRFVLRIEGRVQGVGFRAATLRQAHQHHLGGWVRNTPDGAVEVDVEGVLPAVDAFISWCEIGPPAARVTAVSRTPASPTGTRSFTIR